MAAFTTCVKSKSVDFQKNYLGQNINNFDTVTTQLEVFFANNANSNDLTTWLAQIAAWKTAGDFLPTLTVHGLTFTNCRVTSVNFPTSDGGMNSAIKRGSITITIEERYAGDLTNLDSDNYSNLPTLLAAQVHTIKDVSEELTYNLGVNGQFSLNHSVSVSMADGQAALAKTLGLQIAGSILDSYLPDASAGVYTSAHDVLNTAGQEGLLSSSINQITGEATYTRKIDLLSNVETSSNTSSTYAHSLSLDKEGVIQVSEKGKIIPTSPVSGAGVYSDAVANLPAILAAAGGRCSTVFTTYTAKLDQSITGTLDPLFGTALKVSRTFNEISQEVSYSVTFTNDPTFGSSYTTDRSTDIGKDRNGIITLTEKSSFIQHGEKCDSDPITIYANDSGGSFGRAFAQYGNFSGGLEGGGSFTFKLASRSLSYSPNGKNLSYSVSWTSDNSVSASGSAAATAGITKISTDISDKLPERMRQEFPIASFGMLVHDPDQTTLGSRSVSITANLDRAGAYSLNSPALPSAAIAYMANLARTALLNVFSDLGLASNDIFITECNYNFNSKRNVNLNVTAQYIQAR